MPDFLADIENDIRSVLIRAIVKQRNATIEELLTFAGGDNAPLLRGITLGELVDAARPRSVTKIGRDGPDPGSRKSQKRTKGPNTRTAEGRAAYDQAMLDALAELGGGPVSARDVIAKAGGSSLQARTSLNRLIDAGKVTFTGKARGTRYSLAT